MMHPLPERAQTDRVGAAVLQNGRSAPRPQPTPIQVTLIVLISCAATQLAACVRYDSMRVFYGRDSLVLSPDGREKPRPSEAIADVPDRDE